MKKFIILILITLITTPSAFAQQSDFNVEAKAIAERCNATWDGDPRAKTNCIQTAFIVHLLKREAELQLNYEELLQASGEKTERLKAIDSELIGISQTLELVLAMQASSSQTEDAAVEIEDSQREETGEPQVSDTGFFVETPGFIELQPSMRMSFYRGDMPNNYLRAKDIPGASKKFAGSEDGVMVIFLDCTGTPYEPPNPDFNRGFRSIYADLDGDGTFRGEDAAPYWAVPASASQVYLVWEPSCPIEAVYLSSRNQAIAKPGYPLLESYAYPVVTSNLGGRWYPNGRSAFARDARRR